MTCTCRAGPACRPRLVISRLESVGWLKKLATVTSAMTVALQFFSVNFSKEWRQRLRYESVGRFPIWPSGSRSSSWKGGCVRVLFVSKTYLPGSGYHPLSSHLVLHVLVCKRLQSFFAARSESLWISASVIHDFFFPRWQAFRELLYPFCLMWPQLHYLAWSNRPSLSVGAMQFCSLKKRQLELWFMVMQPRAPNNMSQKYVVGCGPLGLITRLFRWLTVACSFISYILCNGSPKRAC